VEYAISSRAEANEEYRSPILPKGARAVSGDFVGEANCVVYRGNVFRDYGPVMLSGGLRVVDVASGHGSICPPSDSRFIDR
jgi:hypothetical protein